MMSTIGERIKAARKAKGLTQKALGEKLGISFQGIAQWENNLRNPKYETLEKIAEALNTTAFALMGKVRLETQNVIEFFLPIIPPTVTRFYEPDRLREARQILYLALAPYRPKKPYETGLGLHVRWQFPQGRHKEGYRTTRPDTDNLQKLLKDVMTASGFWKDDALVAVEHVEKVWRERPGIYVRVWELEE